VSEDYARPMPYLGWDPCPGDVGSVQHLAGQYQLCATEIRAVRRQVTAVDLSGWLGRTGEAVGAQRDGIAATLASCAQVSDQTGHVTAQWARQLATFQAEADTLEQRARTATQDQEFLQQRQATLQLGATGPVRYAELDAAQSQLQMIQQQAQQLHEDYENAAARLAGQLPAGSPDAWDHTEPVREILEGLLAPFDLAAGDFWVSQLKEVAGVTEEWVNDWGGKIDAAGAQLASGESIVDDLLALGDEGEAVGQRVDAWYGFAPRWLSASAENLSEIRGFGGVMSGLGIVADAGTLLSPQNSGAMGNVDRGVALVNGSLLAADAALSAFPVVGEVAIAATGMYLAGTYLYQHFTPFRDVASDIGRAVVHGVDDVTHDAGDAGHAVRSAWHSVTSTIGSWF
jgi:hypothetical protein